MIYTELAIFAFIVFISPLLILLPVYVEEYITPFDSEGGSLFIGMVLWLYITIGLSILSALFYALFVIILSYSLSLVINTIAVIVGILIFISIVLNSYSIIRYKIYGYESSNPKVELDK